MPFEMDWDEGASAQAERPLHVLVTRYVGRWTWDELRVFNDQHTLPALRDVAESVYLVADFSASGPLPMGDGFRHVRALLRSLPPNVTLSISVSTNMLIRSMVNTFRRLQANDLAPRFYGVETVEQARALIVQHANAQGEKGDPPPAPTR